tara:strand:- start:187 stop:2544 length:2358 start_codon:yes stop_codon:yes gene_type:complete
MSNYTKSFNFKNGVQVDDDNFVVTQGGLVGIGTSVPSKRLDVRGNADISGILTTSGMNVGAAVSVGANIIIDAASGIITATKFVGAAGNLSGIVAIATDGFIAQAGSLSTTAKVGIKTDNPVFDLQIGLNPRTSIGVGITNGDVLISGVTTTGNLVVSGLTTTKDLFSSGVSTFSNAINAPSVNISGGVGVGNSIYHVDDTDTKIAFLNDVISLNVAGSEKFKLTQGGFNFTGISTFGNAIDLNADLDVDGHTNLDNVDIVGTTTTTGDIHLNSSDKKIFLTSDYDQYITANAASNYLVFGTANEERVRIMSSGDVGVGTNNPTGGNALVSNTSTLAVGIVTTNSSFTRDLKVTGISTFNDNIFVSTGSTVGLGTSVFLPDNAGISFGDAEDLRLYHQSSDNTSRIVSKEKDLYLSTIDGTNHVYILSNNKNAIIANADAGVQLYHNNILKLESIGLGASVYGQLNIASLNSGAGGLSSHFGSLRYGGDNLSDYSTRRSLDLINTDSGNINYYINANNLENTGDFHWHKGFNNVQLMTLTGIGGSLGIGVTEPVLPLHVGGGATITGNTLIGNDLTVYGDISGNISALGNGLTNNINNTGFSTFSNKITAGAGLTITSGDFNIDSGSFLTNGSIKLLGQLTVGDVTPVNKVDINNSVSKVFVTASGEVGIKTDKSYSNISINASDASAALSAVSIGTTIISAHSGDLVVKGARGGRVGVGTTMISGSVDFSTAGLSTDRFMILPKVTATERGNLVGLTSGAIIYNTNTGKLNFYNGSSWETVTSS